MMNWSEYEEEERRNERSYLRRIVIAVLLGGLVVAGVLGWAKKASAEEQKATFSMTDQRGNMVRLTTEPCADTPEWMGFKRAEMRYEGVDYRACWMRLGGHVLVLDSNGDATPIPVQAFKKDEAI